MQSFTTNKTIKDLAIIVLSIFFLTFLVWLPFLLKVHSFYNLDFSAGFNTIYRNYDGLEYVVIAKSFYNPSLIKALPYTMTPSYYASHFPGYSIFILLFAPILGFLKSMLFVSLLFTVLSTIAIYFLVKDFKLSSHPLLLSLVSLILPARWLIIHSVGASEPTFIFFTIASLYFLMKFEKTKKSLDVWTSALFGLLAQFTRPPGILLFASIGLYILYKLYLESKISGFKKAFKNQLRYYPFVLIPLGLLAIFLLYGQQYGDFFAYFHSGDNIHLSFPPFQVFNKHEYWVGDIWLEDIVYILVLGFYGGFLLLKQKLYPLAFFVLTYLVATTMVVHRDVSRYSLPVFPFVLIAFEKVLTSKEFRIVLIILALAIYLYAQNFIIENTAPIPNLAIFN